MLKVASFVLAVNQSLPRLVKQAGIDVVHFVFDYPTLPPRARGVGVPVVATVHHLHSAEALGMIQAGRLSLTGLLAVFRDFVFSSLEGAFVKRAAGVIAVSRFTRRSLGLLAGVPGERIRVIHNGVTFDDIVSATDTGSARGRHRLGDGPLVLYVGRLERSKGVGDLVEAFASAVTSFPALRLVIVGGGKKAYGEELKKLVRSRGLEGAVTFTGRVDRADLCELLAASRALVLPSLMEGFGITLIEAMAAGKPCVATWVGAVPEVVIDGKTGVLVPPADPKRLAEGIAAVIGAADGGSGLGEKGREVAMSEFTVERMSVETAKLYGETLGKAPADSMVKYLPNR